MSQTAKPSAKKLTTDADTNAEPQSDTMTVTIETKAKSSGLATTAETEREAKSPASDKLVIDTTANQPADAPLAEADQTVPLSTTPVHVLTEPGTQSELHGLLDTHPVGHLPSSLTTLTGIMPFNPDLATEKLQVLATGPPIRDIGEMTTTAKTIQEYFEGQARIPYYDKTHPTWPPHRKSTQENINEPPPKISLGAQAKYLFPTFLVLQPQAQALIQVTRWLYQRQGQPIDEESYGNSIAFPFPTECAAEPIVIGHSEQLLLDCGPDSFLLRLGEHWAPKENLHNMIFELPHAHLHWEYRYPPSKGFFAYKNMTYAKALSTTDRPFHPGLPIIPTPRYEGQKHETSPAPIPVHESARLPLREGELLFTTTSRCSQLLSAQTTKEYMRYIKDTIDAHSSKPTGLTMDALDRLYSCGLTHNSVSLPLAISETQHAQGCEFARPRSFITVTTPSQARVAFKAIQDEIQVCPVIGLSIETGRLTETNKRNWKHLRPLQKPDQHAAILNRFGYLPMAYQLGRRDAEVATVIAIGTVKYGKVWLFSASALVEPNTLNKPMRWLVNLMAGRRQDHQSSRPPLVVTVRAADVQRGLWNAFFLRSSRAVMDLSQMWKILKIHPDESNWHNDGHYLGPDLDLAMALFAGQLYRSEVQKYARAAMGPEHDDFVLKQVWAAYYSYADANTRPEYLPADPQRRAPDAFDVGNWEDPSCPDKSDKLHLAVADAAASVSLFLMSTLAFGELATVDDQGFFREYFDETRTFLMEGPYKTHPYITAQRLAETYFTTTDRATAAQPRQKHPATAELCTDFVQLAELTRTRTTNFYERYISTSRTAKNIMPEEIRAFNNQVATRLYSMLVLRWQQWKTQRPDFDTDMVPLIDWLTHNLEGLLNDLHTEHVMHPIGPDMEKYINAKYPRSHQPWVIKRAHMDLMGVLAYQPAPPAMYHGTLTSALPEEPSITTITISRTGRTILTLQGSGPYNLREYTLKRECYLKSPTEPPAVKFEDLDWPNIEAGRMPPPTGEFIETCIAMAHKEQSSPRVREQHLQSWQTMGPDKVAKLRKDAVLFTRSRRYQQRAFENTKYLPQADAWRAIMQRRDEALRQVEKDHQLLNTNHGLHPFNAWQNPAAEDPPVHPRVYLNDANYIRLGQKAAQQRLTPSNVGRARATRLQKAKIELNAALRQAQSEGLPANAVIDELTGRLDAPIPEAIRQVVLPTVTSRQAYNNLQHEAQEGNHLAHQALICVGQAYDHGTRIGLQRADCHDKIEVPALLLQPQPPSSAIQDQPPRPVITYDESLLEEMNKSIPDAEPPPEPPEPTPISFPDPDGIFPPHILFTAHKEREDVWNVLGAVELEVKRKCNASPTEPGHMDLHDMNTWPTRPPQRSKTDWLTSLPRSQLSIAAKFDACTDCWQHHGTSHDAHGCPQQAQRTDNAPCPDAPTYEQRWVTEQPDRLQRYSRIACAHVAGTSCMAPAAARFGNARPSIHPQCTPAGRRSRCGKDSRCSYHPTTANMRTKTSPLRINQCTTTPGVASFKNTTASTKTSFATPSRAKEAKAGTATTCKNHKRADGRPCCITPMTSTSQKTSRTYFILNGTWRSWKGHPSQQPRAHGAPGAGHLSSGNLHRLPHCPLMLLLQPRHRHHLRAHPSQRRPLSPRPRRARRMRNVYRLHVSRSKRRHLLRQCHKSRITHWPRTNSRMSWTTTKASSSRRTR